MRLLYLIGVCFLIISCEKITVSQSVITGTWSMEVTMYEGDTQIGEISGKFFFYSDNTAKVITKENSSIKEVLYDWSLQSDHLILVNQSTKFTLPFFIDNLSEDSILLSQSEDVKMNLFR
ncbi:MAG: hypothetical protein OEW67_10260 [Cyclobacteriaceae bacterium]|nr:hypothetical protein [Cyclobacteriaceae bacterium]